MALSPDGHILASPSADDGPGSGRAERRLLRTLKHKRTRARNLVAGWKTLVKEAVVRQQGVSMGRHHRAEFGFWESIAAQSRRCLVARWENRGIFALMKRSALGCQEWACAACLKRTHGAL